MFKLLLSLVFTSFISLSVNAHIAGVNLEEFTCNELNMIDVKKTPNVYAASVEYMMIGYMLRNPLLPHEFEPLTIMNSLNDLCLAKPSLLVQDALNLVVKEDRRISRSEIKERFESTLERFPLAGDDEPSMAGPLGDDEPVGSEIKEQWVGW